MGDDPRRATFSSAIDISTYGNRSFLGEAELNQLYPYAFMSTYTAKLQGKDPTVQPLLEGAGAKKGGNR
jgi:hypothetical protein